MDRRDFIKAAGAAFAVGMAASPSAALPASRQSLFAGHGLPLGLQLYALSPLLDQDFEGTLGRG